MNETTLRDHFAGLAMQGILAMDDDIDFKYISSVSYQMADAMLEERNKTCKDAMQYLGRKNEY